MSETRGRYTPGPRIVEGPDEDYGRPAFASWRVFAPGADPGARLIAQFYGHAAEANARLDAAAPKMLEALRNMDRERWLRLAMQSCVARRAREGLGPPDGLWGIMVDADEAAVEYQQYDEELRELERRRRAVLAAATGEEKRDV